MKWSLNITVFCNYLKAVDSIDNLNKFLFEEKSFSGEI